MDEYYSNYMRNALAPDSQAGVGWGQCDDRYTFHMAEAQPTQAAPLFQSSDDGTRKTPLQGRSSEVPIRSQPTNMEAFPSNFGFAPIQITSAAQPLPIHPAKRQRTMPPSGLGHNLRPVYDKPEQSKDNTVTGPQSECCSSCSEGIPCAEPDCTPCDEPDCDRKTVAVVPCLRKSCEQLACQNQCLSNGIQSQGNVLDNSIPYQSSMSNLTDSPWNPHGMRESNQFNYQSLEGVIDPALKIFEGADFPSASASPAPTTPSMGDNLVTPYSPNNGVPNQFLPTQSAYQTQSGDILSGTGALFNPSLGQWSNTSFENQNDTSSSMVRCTWEGCEQPSMPYIDWFNHFHKTHVDPQMAFGCPIQGETCPQTIDTNPLDHLQTDHGFNFNMDGDGFSCPAPACLPNEIFCDPTMLHNHFDYAHAIPALGTFQCRLETCSNSFPDFSQFNSHISEHHQLQPVSKEEEIDLSALPAQNKNEQLQDDRVLGVDDGYKSAANESVLRCRWMESDKICGVICESEVTLQEHVKHTHLEPLNKHSGYKCLWDGCRRDEKMGEKAGFSQRGKLERHMATHTNFKCSVCDLCGLTFSAPQAMKQHRRLHTGEKPWKCKYCEKSFPQQSARTIHERTHTQFKPLECKTCGKRFSESSNLAKHRKTHGEKGAHVCEFPGCGKCFHRLDQLKRHANTHHTHHPVRSSGSITPSETGSLTKPETEDEDS